MKRSGRGDPVLEPSGVRVPRGVGTGEAQLGRLIALWSEMGVGCDGNPLFEAHVAIAEIAEIGSVQGKGEIDRVCSLRASVAGDIACPARVEVGPGPLTAA